MARVAGDLDQAVKANDPVQLSAEESSDPDDDALSFKWWRYDEADSATSKINIHGATSKRGSFTVPNEPGKTIHIVAEVTDNGTPPLTRYQRIVFTIE